MITIAGCSSSSTPPPEAPAKELVQASSKSVSTPEEEVLELGKRYYSLQLYSIAQEHFQSLKDSYPNSPYLEFAEIKRADSFFEQSQFPEAATAYEEFTKSHPSSSSMPYALLRTGRSLQLSSKGAGRDVTSVEKSIEWFNKVTELFPHSPFVVTAEQFRRASLSTLAEHEKLIGTFYEKKNALSAAAIRDKNAVTTSFNATALKGKVSVVGIRRLPSARGDLRRPEIISLSRTDISTRKILGDKTVISTESSPLSLEKSEDSTVVITNAQCVSPIGPRGYRGVFLYLSRPLENVTFFSEYSRMVFPRKVLSIHLPNVKARPRAFDCFEKGDLFVSATGEVTLGNVQEAFLMPLESPPRLLVTLRDTSYTVAK